MFRVNSSSRRADPELRSRVITDTTAALPRIPPDITDAVSPASPCADAAPPPPHASPVPRAWLPGDDAVLARATWERRAIVPLGVVKDECDGAEAGRVWSEIAREVGDGRTASEVRERWDVLSEEGAYAVLSQHLTKQHRG